MPGWLGGVRMAQSLPSGSQILAEETQKMVQSELIRGQERERRSPPTPNHSRTCSPKTHMKHSCSDTAEGPLNAPSRLGRGGFGGLGSTGPILQLASRCWARFQPDPQRLPGGQRPGISPGGREAQGPWCRDPRLSPPCLSLPGSALALLLETCPPGSTVQKGGVSLTPDTLIPLDLLL